MPYMNTDLPRTRFSRSKRRRERSWVVLGIVGASLLAIGYINREMIQKGDTVEVWAGMELSGPVEHRFEVTQAGTPHALSLRSSKQARLEAVVKNPEGDLIVHHRDPHIHNRGTRLWKFLPMTTGEHVVVFNSFHSGDAPVVDVNLYENDQREETNFFPPPDRRRNR